MIDRLRSKFTALIPHVPASAIEDAVTRITRPNFPSLLQNNREFHCHLRDSVKVEFQADGATVPIYYESRLARLHL